MLDFKVVFKKAKLFFFNEIKHLQDLVINKLMHYITKLTFLPKIPQDITDKFIKQVIAEYGDTKETRALWMSTYNSDPKISQYIKKSGYLSPGFEFINSWCLKNIPYKILTIQWLLEGKDFPEFIHTDDSTCDMLNKNLNLNYLMKEGSKHTETSLYKIKNYDPAKSYEWHVIDGLKNKTLEEYQKITLEKNNWYAFPTETPHCVRGDFSDLPRLIFRLTIDPESFGWDDLINNKLNGGPTRTLN